MHVLHMHVLHMQISVDQYTQNHISSVVLAEHTVNYA